jgi:hypothetical protein
VERIGATNFNGVGREVVGELRKLFREDSGFQLLDPSGAFVELYLDDPVEAAIDGGKPFVRLLVESSPSHWDPARRHWIRRR